MTEVKETRTALRVRPNVMYASGVSNNSPQTTTRII